MYATNLYYYCFSIYKNDDAYICMHIICILFTVIFTTCYLLLLNSLKLDMNQTVFAIVIGYRLDICNIYDDKYSMYNNNSYY